MVGVARLSQVLILLTVCLAGEAAAQVFGSPRIVVDPPVYAPPTLTQIETAPTVSANRSWIQAMADRYGVPYLSIARILHHEYLDSSIDYFGAKDAIQNDCAATGRLKATSRNAWTKMGYFRQWFSCDAYLDAVVEEAATAREDIALFWQYVRNDDEDERRGRLHPVRDARTNWMFSSLGIAQIQIYLALRLAADDWIRNPSLVARFKSGAFWNLSRVAYVLASDDEASIEILAAELAQIRRIWSEEVRAELNVATYLRYLADDEGDINLTDVLWMLPGHLHEGYRSIAKRQGHALFVNTDTLTPTDRAALALDQPVLPEELYLQLHLRGNPRAYARRCKRV